MSQQMLNVFTHSSHRSWQQLAVPTLSSLYLVLCLQAAGTAPPDMDLQHVSVTADI